jgi:Alanyl-tRNA synthetase
MRTDFLDLFERLGYQVLPERPITNAADTLFVMSPIAAHLDLFDRPAAEQPRRMATVQRTFSCDKIDETGEYPLATPFEIQGAFFHFGDPNPLDGIQTAFQMLQTLLGIAPGELWFRTTRRLQLDRWLIQAGANPAQIVTWQQAKPLTLGPNRPSGEYVYLYIPHRHGILPIGGLGFLPMENGFAVDSTFSMERITLYAEQALYLTDTSLFSSARWFFQHTAPWNTWDIRRQHLWIYNSRAIVMLLADGIVPARHYAGHVLKRLIRQLGFSIRHDCVSQADANELILAAIADLERSGYPLSSQASFLQDAFWRLLETERTQLTNAMRRLALEPGPVPAGAIHALAEKLHLKPEWLVELLVERGEAIQIQLAQRYSIKNNGYPYDPEREVDCLALLTGAEQQYAPSSGGDQALQ